MADDAQRRLRMCAAVVSVALGAALAGCSAQTPDPALTAAVKDAASAGRSARIGLELSADNRILGPSLTALLGDMAESLADTSRELELAQPSGENEQYRRDALDATRETLAAVHAAQQGAATADADLDAALDDLDSLAPQP